MLLRIHRSRRLVRSFGCCRRNLALCGRLRCYLLSLVVAPDLNRNPDNKSKHQSRDKNRQNPSAATTLLGLYLRKSFFTVQLIVGLFPAGFCFHTRAHPSLLRGFATRQVNTCAAILLTKRWVGMKVPLLANRLIARRPVNDVFKRFSTLETIDLYLYIAKQRANV